MKRPGDRVDDSDTMHPTNADFGRRLVSTRTAATGGSTWVGAGIILLGVATFLLVPAAVKAQWRQFLPKSELVPWAACGLGVLSLCLGLRRYRRSGSAQHFYEAGACAVRGGRTTHVPYWAAEDVTFVVRSAGPRLERSLAFAGPKGQPTFSLRSDLAEGEEGDDRTPTAASVENVAACVIKAAASRIVTRVDSGEVVRWTAKLWLDQAGLRVGDSEIGRVVPWNVVDGVKDGSKSGTIEVYAFGAEQPVATAQTVDVNALPGFQAFMHLLDRGQAAAKAA